MPSASNARAAALAFLLACMAAAAPAAAQDPAAQDLDDGLLLADSSVYRFVPPTSDAHKAGVRTADFDVRYEGFTNEARAAFAYAVTLWETHVSSPVPIRIQASFTPLGEEDDDRTTLGAARATFIFGNQPAFPFQSTWYPAALAKTLAGQDLTAGTGGEADEADLVAFFNSEFDGWYFGLDGNPPAGELDFVTVVLHEIAHGLGFAGSFRYDDGEEDDECPAGPTGAGCWGFAQQAFPYIFDRFTEDRAEVALLNTSVYPNPSIKLGDVLQSGQVFFDAESVRIVNEEVPVDLYAPTSFEVGSSYSHLDEEVFPPGTPNALMTPLINRNEAIHTPGAVTCAIFGEIGWPLGPDCIALVSGDAPVALMAFDVDRRNTEATVTWRVNRADLVDRFEIQAAYFEEPFETVATIRPDDGTTSYEAMLQDLGLGAYRLRLVAFTASGAEVYSEEVEVVVPVPGELVVQTPFPNPVTATTTVDVFSGQRQDVQVAVYDAAGRRVAVLFDDVIPGDDRRRVRIDASAWVAGVYFVLVTGEDGASESTSFIVVR